MGTEPSTALCLLSVAVSARQWENWVVLTETTWPTKPTSKPFTEKLCWLLFQDTVLWGAYKFKKKIRNSQKDKITKTDSKSKKKKKSRQTYTKWRNWMSNFKIFPHEKAQAQRTLLVNAIKRKERNNYKFYINSFRKQQNNVFQLTLWG